MLAVSLWYSGVESMSLTQEKVGSSKENFCKIFVTEFAEFNEKIHGKPEYLQFVKHPLTNLCHVSTCSCEGCCQTGMELDPVTFLPKQVNQSCCAPVYKKAMESTLWCRK